MGGKAPSLVSALPASPRQSTSRSFPPSTIHCGPKIHQNMTLPCPISATISISGDLESLPSWPPCFHPHSLYPLFSTRQKARPIKNANRITPSSGSKPSNDSLSPQDQIKSLAQPWSLCGRCPLSDLSPSCSFFHPTLSFLLFLQYTEITPHPSFGTS